MRSTLMVLLCVVFVSFCSGCGDDGDGDGDGDADGDTDGDIDGDIDGDADSDGDETPTFMSLTVRVDRQTPRPHVREPAAGAAVAFDLPGGERVETETDDEGLATVDTIDFTLGDHMAVTAYTSGFTARSHTQLTRSVIEEVSDSGEPRALLLYPRRATYELVTLSGTAQNVDSASDTVRVSTTVRGSRHEGNAIWSVDSMPGLDFAVVAVDYRPPPESTVTERGYEAGFMQWTVDEHLAVTEPTEVEVDFVDAAVPETASVTLAIPEHEADSFFARANFQVTVTSWDSSHSVTIGAPTRFDFHDEGRRLECELQFLNLAQVEIPYTSYHLGASYLGSTIRVDGYPETGTIDLAFLEPATFVYPGSSRESLAPGEAAEWELGEAEREDDTLAVVLVVYDSVTDEELHSVRMPPGTTSSPIPALPSTASLAEAYGTNDLHAWLLLCQPHEVHANRCVRRTATYFINVDL